MNTKKQHVIQVAKQLFLEKGVSDYSVQDIIERSNISKGTFYNYFSSKNEFFIDYLRAATEDEFQRRNALTEGQSIQDRDIFAKQILVRVQVNREYTLIPIFEIAFYSGDEVLKKFTQQRYIDELHWLATRLIDIYGSNARMYAEDCAVLLHSMLQNIVQTYKIIGNKSIDFIAIIYYVLQQIDLIIKKMITVQEVPMFSNQFIPEQAKSELRSIDSIVKELESLRAEIPENQLNICESIDFLIEELQKQSLRIHIIRPIVFSLKGILDRSEWANIYIPIYEKLVHYIHVKEQEANH